MALIKVNPKGDPVIAAAWLLVLALVAFLMREVVRSVKDEDILRGNARAMFRGSDKRR